MHQKTPASAGAGPDNGASGKTPGQHGAYTTGKEGGGREVMMRLYTGKSKKMQKWESKR